MRQAHLIDVDQFAASLRNACLAMSLNLNDEQCNKLVQYLGLLVKWNKAYNLTAVRGPEQMLTRHLVDSLSIVPYITAQRVLDVGTGPGLPGIPLAIMFPEKQFSLLDSNGKKTRFLTQSKIELGLHNIEVIHGRVEHVNVDRGYDQIVSRAFTAVSNMIEWCKHLLTPSGEFIAMKGPLAHDEWLEAEDPDFTLKELVELDVPGCEGKRQLIIIGRTQSTV